MVTIRCMTYNHEPYIRQCLEGFVMQKTNFRFEAIVHDDASTDGTAAIIREYAEKYPDIIKPIYETENQYSKHDGSLKRIMNAVTHGKYVALCEGDDYWIDSLKLQKQVDFMNSHSEYSMCFHDAVLHWEDGREEDHSFSNVIDRDYSGVEIFKNWVIPTASVLFRKEVYSSAIYRKAVKNPYFRYGDILLFLSCAKCGKVRGMSNCMSVYRKQEGGVTYNVTTKYSIAHAFHSLNIYKEFGNEYKNLSVDFFMKTILNSYLMTRGDGNPQHKLLWSAFKVQPIITIKFVWKRFFRKDYIKKFFEGNNT